MVGQSAVHEKKNNLLKAQNLNIDSKHFSRKENVSPKKCFSIGNFTYNTQETYLFDTSCYFVIYQQFRRYQLCFHHDLESKIN